VVLHGFRCNQVLREVISCHMKYDQRIMSMLPCQIVKSLILGHIQEKFVKFSVFTNLELSNFDPHFPSKFHMKYLLSLCPLEMLSVAPMLTNSQSIRKFDVRIRTCS